MNDLKFLPCSILRRTLWDRAIFCDRRRAWPVYVKAGCWRVTSPETPRRRRRKAVSNEP